MKALQGASRSVLAAQADPSHPQLYHTSFIQFAEGHTVTALQRTQPKNPSQELCPALCPLSSPVWKVIEFHRMGAYGRIRGRGQGSYHREDLKLPAITLLGEEVVKFTHTSPVCAFYDHGHEE